MISLRLEKKAKQALKKKARELQTSQANAVSFHLSDSVKFASTP